MPKAFPLVFLSAVLATVGAAHAQTQPKLQVTVLAPGPDAPAHAKAETPPHRVAGLTVPGHNRVKFDDTQLDIIENGGDPNQVLCADRAIVGSRFIQHMCYTRGQWSELKREQYRNTDKMMRRLNDASSMGNPADSTPPGANNPP